MVEDNRPSQTISVELKVNGENQRLNASPSDTLLDVLRRAGYASVKRGCDEGDCGSCSVLVDGVLQRACLIYAGQAQGREVTTVESLGTARRPHPIQQAFVEAGAIQCGFCTPGMVLATHALLQESPEPSDDEIRDALDGNLCRCTGYVKIFDAVRLAAKKMRKGDVR
ncbi:MAG: (2Fe-2S)-binding protein [Polyangia bacterium]|jgi:aerobic-type carbon monoxide dehydrogenase small subunit (CoxS/CutS family)|nr:(2Fe-2S)-binding protein [Polyangia bacterium]